MKLYSVIFWIIAVTGFQSACCQIRVVYTIDFEKSSYAINSKYWPELKTLARKLKSDSCRMIKIFGFTDTSGSETYNRMLSEKRVYSVYNYLLSATRFDTRNVYLTWPGESDEVYDLHFPEAHFHQRSVDILIQFNKKHALSEKKNIRLDKNEKDFQRKITGIIFSLPEVKEKNKYIDSLTNHKESISIIIAQKPDEKYKYYWVQAGYNNEIRFETYYNFYVYPDNMIVKFYDPMSDKILSLKKWRNGVKR